MGEPVLLTPGAGAKMTQRPISFDDLTVGIPTSLSPGALGAMASHEMPASTQCPFSQEWAPPQFTAVSAQRSDTGGNSAAFLYSP